MADVRVLNVSAGSAASVTTASIEAAAAAGTIPCEGGKDRRLAVWVKNGDDGSVKFTVKAPASGGGVRTALGDLAVTIAAGDETLIPLFDTARFKVMADNDIDYTLTDTSDGALESGELANVSIVAVQL